MFELPDEHPWHGMICKLVDRLISNGVTFCAPVAPGHENLHDISEMSYRNGYAQGLEDGQCKWVPASLFVPQTHEVRTQDFEDIIVSEVSDPVLGWDGKRMEVVEYEFWNGKPHWSTWNGAEFDVKYWTELPKVPE